MKTIEEACLIAALHEDGDELRRLLQRLLPDERQALAGACRRVQEAVHFEKPAARGEAAADAERDEEYQVYLDDANLEAAE